MSEVNFNNRLKTIGETAFEGCNSLTHVDLPDSVQKIGKKAFYNCVNLKELNLSINLKEVEMAAFETHSKIKIISKGSMILKPKMFDEHYMFDVVQKNAGNYQFENSYFPNVIFKEWKPVAKIMLLVNFSIGIANYITTEKKGFNNLVVSIGLIIMVCVKIILVLANRLMDNSYITPVCFPWQENWHRPML